MTEDDFRRWYSVHRAAFPSVHSWLGKYPTVKTEANPSQKEILTGWFETLSREELADCLAVTKAMQRGEIDPPKLQEEHARAVRREAASRRVGRVKDSSPAPMFENERPVRCLQCRDTGVLTVWHPVSMQAVRLGRFGNRRNRYTCAVRCDCGAGDGWEKALPQRFDPSVWLIASCASPDEEDCKALEEFMSERREQSVVEWVPYTQ